MLCILADGEIHNSLFFFFQAEDGIRDHCVTGVQTCALPISPFRSVRDLWRHRLDLIETSGHDMDVDAVHDGRIIAVIVRGRAAAASRVLGDRSVDLAVGDLGTGMWRFGTPSEPDSTIELDALTLIRLLLAWRSPAATRERSRIDGDVKSAM